MSGTLGILLAGGRGSRLGADRPKALVRLAGRTLLERALEALEACCDEAIVVAPAALELPVAPVRRVDDLRPGEGPLAALVAGMESRAWTQALALGVDLALVRPAALRALRSRLAGAPVAVPAPFGVAQPLAAWYATSAHAPLAAALARGERALAAAVMRLAPVRVGPEELAALEGGEEAFLNVNTPGDLARAEALLAARGRRVSARP